MKAQSRFRKLLTVPTILLIGLLMIFAYILAWPTYKHTIYQMPNCPGIYLTKIEYTKFLYRGFAFAYGIHKERGIPESECLFSSKMTGMDSILELWIVCKDDKVILMSGDDLKVQGRNNKKIFFEPSYSEQVEKLNANHNVIHLIEE